MAENYWTRWNERRLGRRRLFTRSAAVTAGVGGLVLVGCGDDDDAGGNDPTQAPTAADGDNPTPTTGSGSEDLDPRFGHLQSGPGDRIVMGEDTFFPSGSQTSGGTINWSTQYQAATIYPPHTLAGDVNLSLQPYQPLYMAIDTGAALLQAADRVEDIDELTWNVHLRDNLRFHDISPVDGRLATPEDVAFSYAAGLEDPASYQGRQAAWIETITAMPDNVVQFKSRVPNAGRVGEGLQLLLMAPEAVDQLGEDIHRRAIGTGPWMLEGEYAPDQVAEFVRHPEFMIPGRPFAERMTFRSITDQQAHVAAFRSGQIDYMSRDLPKQIAESVASGNDAEVVQLPFLAPEMIWIKSDVAPFDNLDLRKAVSLAIDRQDLIDRLVFGEGFVNGPIPWGIDAWSLPQQEVDDFYKPDQYEANLAEAQAIIDANGGPEAIGEISMIAQNDIAIPVDMAPLLAGYLERLGLQVSVRSLPSIEWISALYSPDWHISCNQWGNQLDPQFFLSMYTNPASVVVGENNRGSLYSDAVDEAVLATLSEFDQGARLEKVHEAQRLIMANYGGAISLFDGYGYYPKRNTLRDFRVGDSQPEYTQWDYWFTA